MNYDCRLNIVNVATVEPKFTIVPTAIIRLATAVGTVILHPMVSVICRTQPLLRQHHQHHLDVGGTFKLSERKACSRRRCC